VALLVVAWAFSVLAILLVAALVTIPLIWGPTPLYIAVVLALAWLWLLALLIFMLRSPLHRTAHRVTGLVGSFLLLGALAIGMSQWTAYTPSIVDGNGDVVRGSIASLEKVTLNGSEQWLSIRGISTEKPVLLWLAGGPGGSQLATARYHLAGLEGHFVVVNWEQPGSGKSYSAVAHSALTPERYISDAYALVKYLKERFDEEKIYLIGESWGSALGIWLAQRYPEEFRALVTTGMMVDFIETDLFDYNFALKRAKERGDARKVAELEGIGPPPYFGDGVIWKQAAYLLDGFGYMNENPNIAQEDGFDTFKDVLSPEYGLYDKLNWARGVVDAGNVIFPQLWKADVDFRRDAPSLEVPVYFFIGRHDINAPPALAQEYFKLLDAPRKDWVWFERSGHNPWVHESDRFVQVMVDKVLAETTASSTTFGPTMKLEPCTLPGSVKAECGTVQVYEDRSGMTGKKIDLRVAVIRAKGSDPLPDPVFFLAGGPGGAATGQWASAAKLFPTLNEQRDFVLVDQRGTGGSNRLLCPPLPEDIFSMSPEDAQAASLEYGKECMEELGSSARFYTTNYAMDDLDDVRAALGYDVINLYGGSYGATAAQVYLKQHEERVRTVILDGATLLDVPIFEMVGKNRQRALDMVFDRCAADTACSAAYPNLRDEFEAVLERLRKEPVTTTIINPLTREPIVYTASAFHGTINWTLFSAGQVAHLPYLIHQAYGGDFEPLAAAYAGGQPVSTEAMRQVMYYSIVCNEGWARWSPEEAARNSAGIYFESEEVNQARLMEQGCKLVPKADLPPGFNDPVRSEVPVLLMLGDADPQDPEGNVADAPEELPNSMTVVVPGQGHGVVQYGCLPNLAAAFVNNGTTEGLDTSCVGDISIPPFVVQGR
jgi:pimeloyl-ACP methyl ester carboxylesterase